jgi:osmotically-inducible protein OsmY
MDMNDTLIKERVLNALRSEHDLRSEDIIIDVDDGVVTLSGLVHTYPEKYIAEQLVKTVFGVRDVIGKMSVDLNEGCC